MIKYWSYLKEYKKYRLKILKKIDLALKSGNLFFGNELKKFEKKFIKIHNFKYGVAVGSGTDALLLALKSLNIGNNKNDEVITVSNTAIPTVSAIISAGAKPVFVDIGKDYLINPKLIQKKINKNTRAIIPVHLYGKSCNMKEILKIAKKNKVKVIEDCAQSQGSKSGNKYVGSLGDLGCFSFYPTKILGAYGDGGFVSTNSLKLFKKLRRMRFYGIEQFNKKNKFNKKYYSNEHGINSRLDEIHSSILNFKLKKIKKFISKRKKIAQTYIKGLKNSGLTLPEVKNRTEHVFHLFTVYHSKRNKIIKALNNKKILVRIIYPYPIHLMKGYKNYSPYKSNLPITEKMYKGIFSLPLYPDIKSSEVKRVIFEINKILRKI
tara:strand:+ start:5900 stop:7033 length:1134 start_codon:yes stop_codon:yes gene_type:complete